MGSFPDGRCEGKARPSKKANDRRKAMAGSIITGVDCSERLSVPDVYALLYGDEVDWDAELAELKEDR
jgi:hypothetical protein